MNVRSRNFNGRVEVGGCCDVTKKHTQLRKQQQPTPEASVARHHSDTIPTNDYIHTKFRISFKESIVDSDELTSLLNSDNAMEIRKLPCVAKVGVYPLYNKNT